ncbi:TIGR00341 family protein [Prevotella sp. A2931]|uniref:TIGR00341 family protein n=1 Tax=Prevotella illustrans TaxID=2800387 RepID=A0ABS3M6S1_9BACT|nr:MULTISPECIES: TIGR00341 family protein [Prevotella]MBO1363864.1 TIGR00341 family protein [Prevotella illustrans]PTL26281.1 TIGR00341 family protein [Prevotella sp. oral taxon 820]
MTQDERTLWQVVKGYFNALPDKESEVETINQISSGVRFHGSNLWVLIFAIFIASLGLNLNSTAIIIGAMLISPLMGPIIGMGLSVGINDFELLKRSVKNYLVATVISVITATIYFIITPLNEAQSELLSRTSPSLYDVLVAIFGGAAGILAIATKGKGNVIPGVAIATALMPPLCTAGYGLAVGEFSFFFGAFYLFFINTVFIALSTFVGVRMLRFKRKTFVNTQQLKKVKRYIIAITIITMLPATYMTIQIIRTSVRDSNTQQFIKNELTFKGTQILSHSRNDDKKTIRVVAIGKSIEKNDIDKANLKLENYHLAGYRLNVIQGYQSDSLLLLEGKMAQVSKATQQQLIEQTAQLNTVSKQLQEYTAYENLGKEISQEVKAVCPKVKTISLSKVSEARTDTSATLRYTVAVAGCVSPLSGTERTQLQRWLKARSKADSLRLITTL